MEEIVKCDKCGGEYGIGDFPFCKGNQGDHGEMMGFDEAFEPYVDTQLLQPKDPRCDGINERGQRGITIHSRSERRALMKELGLQFGSQKFNKFGKKLSGIFFDMGSHR